MSTWLKWLILGALSIIFGIFVLAHPVAASLAVTTLAGILFMVAGGFQTFVGFDEEGTGAKILGVGLGVLMLLLGLSLLMNPLEGVISLAMLVTFAFALGGLLRLLFAWGMRQTQFFWPMLISGALSILLAGYILANFFEIAPQLLGILLGVELLFNGAGLIILAIFKKRAQPPT